MDTRHTKSILRLAVAAAGLCLANAASATLSIDVGTLQIQPGETKTFPITAIGGDPVQGLNFRLQLGDGGTVNGGSLSTPTITNVDIVGTGTIFHSSNTGQSNDLSSGQLWAISTTTDPNVAGTVPAGGIVAYVTINAQGTQVGQEYPVLLSGVAKGIFGDPGVETDFAGIPATITNGALQIVPEPMAMGTLVSGSLMLLVRKRRK